MRARRAPRHQFTAHDVVFDDHDAVSGVSRLEGAGLPLDEIAAALNADWERAAFHIGFAASPLFFPRSVDGLRRLASQRRRRPSPAQIRAGNRYLAPPRL